MGWQLEKSKYRGLKYFTSINSQALQQCWKTGAQRPALLAGQAGLWAVAWVGWDWSCGQWARRGRIPSECSPRLPLPLILRTAPQGRKLDGPSPVRVTKPFMLTQMSGKGRWRAYLLYLLSKTYLRRSEEVEDSVRKRNEILCKLGRIAVFLRNSSHWGISVSQKRMIKGLFFFSDTEKSQVHFEHLPNNTDFYKVISSPPIILMWMSLSPAAVPFPVELQRKPNWKQAVLLVGEINSFDGVLHLFCV